MTEDTPSEFPPPQLPTVFADGVTNLATSLSVAKFYLARNDPSLTGDGQNRLQVFAQIIMPISGFLQAFAFFERTIDNMAKDNPTIARELAAARKALKQ
jgi:hypothetical protein